MQRVYGEAILHNPETSARDDTGSPLAIVARMCLSRCRGTHIVSATRLGAGTPAHHRYRMRRDSCPPRTLPARANANRRKHAVPRPLLWSLPALLILLASPVHAFTPPVTAVDVSVPLRGGGTPIATPSQQRAFETSPTWRAFIADHGSWTALWNAGTGSPHRAFGPAIALAGFRDDPAGVDQAVRRFIAGQRAFRRRCPARDRGRRQGRGSGTSATVDAERHGGAVLDGSSASVRTAAYGVGVDAHRIRRSTASRH